MGYYHTIDVNRFISASRHRRSIRIEKFIFPKADGIIVTKKGAKNYIHNNYDLSQVHLVVNSIDTSLFKPEYAQEKDIDILFVGRLDDVKNLEYLLREIKGEAYKVFFIGEGRLKSTLLEYASQKIIDLKIVNRIDNSDLPSYYNRAKVFTLLSKWEGNPKSLLEAMACGCISIGNDTDGINNVITHSETGIIVNIVTNNLNKLLKNIMLKPNEYKHLAENGVKYVRSNYSIDELVIREANIYRELV